MNFDLQLGVGLVVIALLISSAIGYWSGRAGERRWWQDEMIRRRHAVYHWENGKWYWNEDEPKMSRDPAANKLLRSAATTGIRPGFPTHTSGQS